MKGLTDNFEESHSDNIRNLDQTSKIHYKLMPNSRVLQKYRAKQWLSRNRKVKKAIGVAKFFPLSLSLRKLFYIPSLNWWISIISELMDWRHYLLPKMRKVVIMEKSLTTPIVTKHDVIHFRDTDRLYLISHPYQKCQCIWYYGMNNYIALWCKADLHMVEPSMFSARVMYGQSIIIDHTNSWLPFIQQVYGT